MSNTLSISVNCFLHIDVSFSNFSIFENSTTTKELIYYFSDNGRFLCHELVGVVNAPTLPTWIFEGCIVRSVMSEGIASDLRQEANVALLEVDKGLSYISGYLYFILLH